MVRIADENERPPTIEMVDPIILQRKRKVRLTTFTSSASLILSWPFPLVILSFQSNQCLLFDPRIYTALIMAYLFSGSVKRLLLQRFLSPSFFNAIIPTVLGLIGNGVFMTALYKGNNWNWVSVFFMFGGRLCFGWSTYSAEDYNRRAKSAAKTKRIEERIAGRVVDMVPDLQDAAFHAGVIVALVICFILEACLHSVGPQLTEFYSVLILSGLSTLLSLISAPILHKAVKTLVNVPVEESTNGQTVSGSGTREMNTEEVERPSDSGVRLHHPICYRSVFRSLRDETCAIGLLNVLVNLLHLLSIVVPINDLSGGKQHSHVALYFT